MGKGRYVSVSFRIGKGEWDREGARDGVIFGTLEEGECEPNAHGFHECF